MPTGYTADIAKGITFKQYALNCARAFGELIEMRDEPADAPIPEEFKPSDYHLKAVKAAQRSLDKIKGMSVDTLQAQADKQYQETKKRHEACIKENAALKAKYDAMLAEVNRYKAPSREHEGFAKFMREQITGSIEFDCGGDYHQEALAKCKPTTGKRWKIDEIQNLKAQIRYHTDEHKKEVECVAARNLWVRQLRQSLEAHA